MTQIGSRLLASVLLIGLFGILAFGQGTTSSLSGVVKDANGAVVAGAAVNVKNQDTGQESNTTTADNGTFSVPSLNSGLYTVTVTATNFKKTFTKDVAVDVGVAANVNLTLAVGAASEVVEVVGTGEVLQADTTNVSSTLTGRQIQTLPLASRSALDLVLFLPGTQTVGRPRQSTINGLPKGALNIELDGINIQDNLLKGSDGFFTYVRPSVDAVSEVTVSTATPGAESSSEGAVAIKFVTKSGSNAFHGTAYEYLRNPALNANYFFNNRDLPPNPGTGQASRTRVVLNQFGFAVGGPVIKDKLFFFVNYEEYHLPEQTLRQRVILTPLAQSGTFQYTTGTTTQSVNLLAAAAAFNTANGTSIPTTLDPTVSSLLGQIATATASTTLQGLGDPNLLQSTFINGGGQTRKYPTIRFDYNVTSKHHLENIYNYQQYRTKVDFLNNADPAFPNFPNFGGQDSNRFSDSMALRSTLSNSLVNEARFGFTGGTVVFFPEIGPSQFTNQGNLSLGIGAADGISSATVQNAPQRRNTPTYQFNDTLSYTRGTHTMNFGYTFTKINSYSEGFFGGFVAPIGFGIDTTDPANNLFSTKNFPGASTAQLSAAAGIYATLVGRVTSIGGTAYQNEKTGAFTNLGDEVQRSHQTEMGWFAQDNWRVRPNLTVNYGLRYELQFPFHPDNPLFSQVSYAGLFGVSGAGNFFQPGTLPGTTTQVTPYSSSNPPFPVDKHAFAPSLGFAYSPNFKDGILHKLFGDGTQTVIRAGGSIAYNRDGINLLYSILGSNPGFQFNTTQSISLANLPVGTLLRNPLPTPSFPASPTYPVTPAFGDSVNGFIPNLVVPMVPSWTFGIQRELNKDTVLEVRYVGNRGIQLLHQYNINEINNVESGFFNEFLLAQQNFVANNNAGGTRAGSFAYFGSGTGTSPLPIIWSYFQAPGSFAGTGGATNSANYTSSTFRSTGFENFLSPFLPSVGSFAANLAGNVTRINNAIANGQPANLFLANPQVAIGGSFLVDNSARSQYDAGVIELRRRLSKGLLIQGSYVFSKSMSNTFNSSSIAFFQEDTLRNPGLNKSLAPFDLTHGLKFDWIYELPFGQGKSFLNTENKIASKLISGWEMDGTARIQSGSPVQFGNVQLIGMTQQDLESMIRPYADVARDINTGLPVLTGGKTTPVEYFLPFSVIQNTNRAFNETATSVRPTGAYFAPTNFNQPVAFGGQFGYGNLVAHGPHFSRFDISMVKRTKFSERLGFEFRAEFLNAFNTPDFIIGNPANDINTATNFTSNAFGRITQAYRDTSTTNDPGGRLIQFVARFTF